MIDFLINLDTDIFLFFNGIHCDFADQFMKLSSDRFVWIPMYAALLIALVRSYGWRKTIIIILATAIAVTAADQLCATVIRPEVQRLRPANLQNPLSALVHIVDGYRGGNFGFPSCHAANTFALVGLMAPLIGQRRFAVAIGVWALLNCYSRIHLGVHYPGDLLVGGIIGGSIGLICFLLVRTFAFGGKKTEADHSSATLYIASPVIAYIPSLKLNSISIRHSDFVVLTLAATALCIALKAL